MTNLSTGNESVPTIIINNAINLFYRAMLCIRGTMGLCLSVSVSVTSRSSTKMAKQRITQTAPLGTLVF